jgi:hypothetical protein
MAGRWEHGVGGTLILPIVRHRDWSVAFRFAHRGSSAFPAGQVRRQVRPGGA